MIFQTVPVDQVGRSLKAISGGALTRLGFGQGLQVAPQGAPKVVLRAMSLLPLSAGCRHAQGSSQLHPPTCRNTSPATALLTPAREQLWGHVTKCIPLVSGPWSQEARMRHSSEKPPCSLDSEVLISVAIRAGLTHLRHED